MSLKGSLKDQLKKRAQAGKENPDSASSLKPKNVKARWIMLGGGVFICAMVLSSQSDQQPVRQATKPKDSKFIDISPKSLDIKGNPELRSQVEYNSLKESLKELKAQNDELRNRMKSIEEKKAAEPEIKLPLPPVMPPSIVPPPGTVGVIPPAPPVNLPIQPPSNSPAPPAIKIQDPKDAKEAKGPKDISIPEREDGEFVNREKDTITISRPSDNRDKGVYKAPPVSASSSNTGVQSAKKTTAGNLLVSGSFAPITLLTGLDAGVGQASQANPEPILMRVQDNAQLPGSTRFKLRSCFMLGSAFGDASSERVKIRLARLSCVSDKDKLVLSAPIQGYVVDADGKLGLRGVVTDRQGLKLAQASLASFAQGLAGALGTAQGTITNTAFGATNAIGGADALRASGLSGAKNAVDQLADFYLKEAQTLFPTITVDALRQGTVVITSDSELKWSEGPSFNGN